MIIMPVKEGENIEKALKKFKRKYERTGVLKELRRRQYFTKPFGCEAYRHAACHLRREAAPRRGIGRLFSISLILIIDKNFFILSISFLLFYSGLLSVSPAKLNFFSLKTIKK